MLNPILYYVKLSKENYLRYSKQIILENIGIEGQKRIKTAKILMIGAGGLSCPIMMYLTGCGVGYIGIVDLDKIEVSNLNRQILYNEEHVNKFKVQIAKIQLNKINKDCKIIPHQYKFTSLNSKELIKYYDIIIDTSDNFKTRNNINQICYELSKIYIYGAVDSFFGQMSIFNYKDGIKYNNLYSKYINEDKNCNTNGIIGVTTGYIGTLQAIETIKIITGSKQKLNNKIILCDLINTKTTTQKIYSHRINIDKILINKKYIQKLESYNNNKQIVIDIRSNEEFLKTHVKKSINIPLKSFKTHKTLKFLRKYGNQNLICIYCNNLKRSLLISSLLTVNQIQHKILKTNNKTI